MSGPDLAALVATGEQLSVSSLFPFTGGKLMSASIQWALQILV